MQKLKFYAREDLLVRKAGVAPRVGEATRYYGRKFDAASRGYPATAEAVEVDADSEHGRKCIRACVSESALWPADEATAKHCGVSFTPVEFVDGAWVVKAAPVKAEPAKRRGSGSASP